MAKKRKKSSGHIFLYIVLLLFAFLAFLCYKIFASNTAFVSNEEFIFIHTGSNYEQLNKALKEKGIIDDYSCFDYIAKIARLPENIHPGKYKIKTGMSNFDIIRLLRSGKQTPIKIVINKFRTKHDFINQISMNLECDSMSVDSLIHNRKYLAQFGLDTNTVLCAILPDTYDFYWNTTADKAFRKIEKNYSRFWDTERKEKAKRNGLSQIQATIIASIVEEETNLNDDKPNIASVYVNRLKKGMKLQADPTVKYAIGDFGIKRVTGTMLNYNSPYNTYMYSGLPPGPICTPSLSSLNAVLDVPETKYLYFCAKDDFSGYSAFATDFKHQQDNARAYQKALNKRGIK